MMTVEQCVAKAMRQSAQRDENVIIEETLTGSLNVSEKAFSRPKL